MIRFEFLALALLAAPLTAPGYVIPHVSHGCMSTRRVLSLSLRPARVSSPVALQMNLGERFVRLVKANINDLLSKNEDPEKLLVQVVEDMQKELIEFRQTYAEVAASQKRLEKQRIQAEGLTQEWLKRAKLALENGDEMAARAALERKNQQQELATSLANQIQAQSQAVSNLYSKMQELEAKITEARAKKDQLKARAQTAKVSTKINDMLSKTSTSGALDAFNRMEDKIEKMEAEAEVAAELSGDMGLNDKFRKLEASSKVDDDLAALKGLLGGSSAGAPKYIAAEVVRPRDDKVEEEMRRMRDSLGK